MPKLVSFLLACLVVLLTTPIALAACNPDIPGDCAAGVADLEKMFAQVVSLLVPITFMAVFVVIVFGGFKYIMSGGEPKALASAKQTIIWALLGILFVILAWLSIQLISAFTGVDFTQFSLSILSNK